MGNSIEYQPPGRLKKPRTVLKAPAAGGYTVMSHGKQTLYDYTPKAVPNQHNIIVFAEPQVLIAAHLGNGK
jgi:hypothetical protein